MRLLIVLFVGLLTNAFTAEREMLTLKDGRVLLGLYDEDAGTIEVESPGGTATAKVRIQPDQIAARKSLVEKEPERNFVEEAKKLHDQQAAELAKREAEAAATAREIAKQKEERERRAAAELAAEQRRLEMEDRVRELRREQDEADRKIAAIKAAQDAEEQRVREIAAKKQAAEIEAEQARLHEIAAAGEQRRIEKAKTEAAEKLKREQDDAARAAVEQRLNAAKQEAQAWGGRALIGGLLFALFLFWLLPALIAYRRRFHKRVDVTILLVATFVAMIVCAFLGGGARYNVFAVIGCVIAALGWLGGLVWVLIASSPPERNT